MKKLKLFFLLLVLFVASLAFAQVDASKSSLFDNGKMWTFDYPPMDYFAKTYNFTPDKAWFEKARLAAIRLPGCTASFISEDGLIMTNHHCARGPLDQVNRPGENLGETGFYAPTLDEERKVPGLYVDQLQLIEDVTADVQKAFESGKTDNEKIEARNKKIKEIQEDYSSKTKLTCNVITFYNGGRYSLYGYKRYTDVRIVFAVETQIGFYGGDPDNFTYPRYDVDLSLFRAYDENGKPLKPQYFFKFSDGGVKEGDACFVIGNPGRTSRLLTYAQLEFNRDYQYAYTLNLLDSFVKNLSTYLEKHPEKKLTMQTQLFGYSNAQKAYGGQVEGLKDKILMARKFDFEKNFKEAVMKDPKLKAKYATVWDEIEKFQKEKANFFLESIAFGYKGRFAVPHFALAADLVNYAEQMKKSEDQRDKEYKGVALDQTKTKLVLQKGNIDDPDYTKGQVAFVLSNLKKVENKNEFVKNFFKSSDFSKTTESGDDYHKTFSKNIGSDVSNATEFVIKGSILNDPAKVKGFVENPESILKSDDPVINLVKNTMGKGKEASDKLKEISGKEQAKVQVLGMALYDVYGTQMPPDATFTLRIADGVVKGYEYNGTIAPPITTFYGMYDRYYSFKKADWDLPERWKNKPATMDLSKPLDFVCTADIIGGNSGSPVINKNQEVVGLVFDGNIESLPGEFIFVEEKNRTVSVHSEGILEALKSIYKADRIVAEIKAGKIVELPKEEPKSLGIPIEKPEEKVEKKADKKAPKKKK